MYRLSRFLFLGVVLFLTAGLVWAQTDTGQITGTITDPSGAVVPSAKIAAKNVATQAVRNAVSNATGNYVIPNLLPGTYDVSVEAAGFATKRARTLVSVGARIGLDFKMEVGATTELVEVNAQAAEVVNTQTQTVSTTISSQQVMEMPSLTRNPYDFVSVSGNVADDSLASGRGTGYAINGQRSASTGILLDGTGNTDDFTASVGINVPLDSVQEFSVLTSNFTAEYGRAGGGIVNVATKSGTNQFHGTAYEFNRVSRIASNSFDNNAYELPKSPFTRNQFGFSLGGPAIKDKLFFFGNIEWIRVRSAANTTSWVPTSQLIAATASNTQDFFSKLGTLKSGMVNLGTYTKNDLAAAGFDACGGSTTGGCALFDPNTPMWQKYSYSVPSDSGAGNPQNTYMATARVDYNLSDRTQITARFNRESRDYPVGANASSPYQGFDTGYSNKNDSIMLSVIKTISPTIVSQSKVNYNRLNEDQPLGDFAPSPTLYMRSSATRILGDTIALPGYLPFNPGSAIPFGGPQNFFQTYQDFSMMKGTHQIRFGANLTYIQDNRTFGAYENSVQTLGTNLGSAMDNLFAGQLTSYSGAVDPRGAFPCKDPSNPDPTCLVTLPATAPSFSRSNGYKEIALYGMDSWKVTHRITLNLGVRWEYFGVQHSRNPSLESNYYDAQLGNIYENIRNGNVATTPNSPVGGLWAPDYNNFAPRLGFAWDVTGDGKTSVRGGYGMAYERNFGNVTFNVIQNPPNYAVITLAAGADVPSIAITSNNAGPLAGTSGSKALPKVSLRNVDSNIKTAYTHFWSFAVERQVSNGLVAAVEYSGSAGRKLYSLENPNRVGYGNALLGDPCNTGDPYDCTNRLRTTQYSAFNRRGGKGFSDYNSVNLRLTVNNFKDSGLYLTTNMTYSKAEDNLSSTFSESWNNFDLGLLDPFNPGLDKGLADFNVPFRFSIGGLWDIPFAKNLSNPVAKKILDGWQLAPILTASTGHPFTIFDCWNAYYEVCPRAMFDGPIPTKPTSAATATGTPNTFNYYPLDTLPFNSDWVNPITGTAEVGPFPSNMSGRNRVQGPGAFSLDMGIYKNIQINERFKLQFRSEWYNMFNHPNLIVLGGDADVSASSYVSGYMDSRRNIQLALKLIF